MTGRRGPLQLGVHVPALTLRWRKEPGESIPGQRDWCKGPHQLHVFEGQKNRCPWLDPVSEGQRGAEAERLWDSWDEF